MITKKMLSFPAYDSPALDREDTLLRIRQLEKRDSGEHKAD